MPQVAVSACLRVYGGVRGASMTLGACVRAHVCVCERGRGEEANQGSGGADESELTQS